MKTKIITKLKKELLLVELPENGYYGEYRDGIEVRDFLTDEVLTLANYTILGTPDEIKEDDARELVETGDADPVGDRFVLGYRSYFDGYENDVPQFTCETALESFNSALESEIYWDVNPVKLFDMEDLFKAKNIYYETIKQFNQAQEKTFDKKRTLIFVKN